MAKEESTRKVIKRLKEAGFTIKSTDGRHTKWTHPTGVWLPVPDSHSTISAGIVRKIDRAIADAKAATKGDNE